ncbi:hypothetical protein HDV63DRAFT_378952 [Trichoderma sp. SZMC 28014]
MKWAEARQTAREEDKAYSLLGIFNISMPILYGEGREWATRRLNREIRLSAASNRAPVNVNGAADDLSIVYYRKSDGLCNPHDFELNTDSANELGRGSYGRVYKVKCTQCREVYARKIIKFPSNNEETAREKQMRDTHLELKCYMTLDHPHIIQYIHHKLSEKTMEIYTEYCQFRDLEHFSVNPLLDKFHTGELAWTFLEAIASALARCHHGLGASQVKGVLSAYSEFQKGWTTILHRDIKPGNGLHSIPDNRPTALQLLAVAVKSDTSEKGLHRSASFWKAISLNSDTNLVPSVIKYFVSKHLPTLAKMKTIFDPKEVAIIMSLVKTHCSDQLFSCHTYLCSGFISEMAGATAFHALACVGTEHEETLRLAMDDSKWPESRELARIALKKNNLGLLPSAMAAWNQNLPLYIRLSKLEDQCRLISRQGQHDTTSAEEFDFMFKMLTSQTNGQFSIPASHAARAMIETAQRGYSNVVRKLVEIGVQPSIRGKRYQTALHIFAYEGNQSMVRFLAEHGAEIDARDTDSRTPLHWAAWNGKLETTRLLLSRRADVNVRDRLNRTPLYGAAGGGHVDVVRLLLRSHADKTIRGGEKEETPLERAGKRKRMRIVELLNGGENS